MADALKSSILLPEQRPLSTSGAAATSAESLLPIVSSQRERFKQRNAELEAVSGTTALLKAVQLVQYMLYVRMAIHLYLHTYMHTSPSTSPKLAENRVNLVTLSELPSSE